MYLTVLVQDKQYSMHHDILLGAIRKFSKMCNGLHDSQPKKKERKKNEMLKAICEGSEGRVCCTRIKQKVKRTTIVGNFNALKRKGKKRACASLDGVGLYALERCI